MEKLVGLTCVEKDLCRALIKKFCVLQITKAVSIFKCLSREWVGNEVRNGVARHQLIRKNSKCGSLYLPQSGSAQQFLQPSPLDHSLFINSHNEPFALNLWSTSTTPDEIRWHLNHPSRTSLFWLICALFVIALYTTSYLKLWA